MNENLRVVVLTCNAYLWALRPLDYLLRCFWPTQVLVAGYAPPAFELPHNFSFLSLAPQEHPQATWTNGLLALLSAIPDEHFILMLEDYWPVRHVSFELLAMCADYMRTHPDVLRLDLTTDRLYAGSMRDVEYWGYLDIIETPHDSPYQMSLQAGIWNRALLLDILAYMNPCSPWQLEMYTRPPDHMRVCGTRQWPLRYANGVHKGEIDAYQLSLIPAQHRAVVEGMLPKEFKVEVA